MGAEMCSVGAIYDTWERADQCAKELGSEYAVQGQATGGSRGPGGMAADQYVVVEIKTASSGGGCSIAGGVGARPAPGIFKHLIDFIFGK